MTAPLQQFQQLRQDLTAQFPERREVIEGALYALLSSERLLLLGPPDPQLCAPSLTSRIVVLLQHSAGPSPPIEGRERLGDR